MRETVRTGIAACIHWLRASLNDRRAAAGDRDARAKINLGLAVTGRRPDGYHELRSVFLRIGLSDRVEARSVPGGFFDSLSIGGDPECPVDGNLVLRATAELRARMIAAAVRAGESVGYRGAGTVEFLLDPASLAAGDGSGEFYFLEMNARLQLKQDELYAASPGMSREDIVASDGYVDPGAPVRFKLGWADSKITDAESGVLATGPSYCSSCRKRVPTRRLRSRSSYSESTCKSRA